jgi:hypothetical protein
MLNLATVQQFYIQLEAFIIHFAALPWLFYTLIRFLESKTRKDLLIFLIVSLVATAQGFIPPLFVVYFVLLLVFLTFYFITKPNLQRAKRALFILVLTLLINAYWLLPVGYYSATHSDTYLNSYNNLASTEDFILKNKKYGNLADAALLKGFIFEAIDGNQSGQTFLIFDPWIKHLEKFGVKYIGFLFFAIVILGAIFLIKDKKKYASLAFSLSLILSFSLLATNTPPFSLVTDILDKIPILKQAFRVAFTKFSIATAFFYAIAIGVGISIILSAIKRHSYLFLSLLIILLLYFSFPVFQGNFLYSRTKISIPNSYFQLFDFFKNQDQKTRIADFPQGWNWGWNIYRWGYSGSGFLWYGIPQPILDRSFDVWGKSNENYYWELSYAIYSEKFNLIDQVMEKYQVNWIILDKNVISYLNPQEFIYLQKLESYLNSSSKFNLVKTFKSTDPKVRDIKVYTVNLKNPVANFQEIISENSLKNIGPTYNFSNYDSAFQKYGSYYDNPSQNYDVYYPFRSLFSGRKADELATRIEETKTDLVFKTQIPDKGFSLKIPSPDPNYDPEKPNVSVNGDNLMVSLPKNQITLYQSKNDPDFSNPKSSNCQTPTASQNLKQENLQGNILRFTSKNTQNCHDIILSQLEERYSYLITFESRHLTGRQLELGVINRQARTATLDILLPQENDFKNNNIVIPPMQYYGLGYTLNFNNISIGDIETVNDIKNISVYRMPFYFLTNIELLNTQKHNSDNNVFVFYQSYDPSWKAYELKSNNWLDKTFPFIFGKELKNHFLVNNWANGWIIKPNSNKKVVVVYLPQYLEYLGFIILIVPVLIVLLQILASKSFRKRPLRVDL